MTDTIESPSSVDVARSVAAADPAPAATIYAVLEGTWDRTFVPAFDGPPPEQGVFGYADWVVQTIGGVLSLPGELVDAGLAGITSAILPTGMGMPAAIIGGGLHLGLPHYHPQTVLLGVPMPGVGPTAVIGALTVHIGGMPALRCGDIGFALGCLGSPVFEVFTGSSNVFIGGKRAARAMDFTRHCDPFLGLLSPGAAIGSAIDLMSCAAAATNFAAHTAAAVSHSDDAASAETAAEAEIANAEAALEIQQAIVNSIQIIADASLSAFSNTIGAIPPVGLMGDGLVMGAVASNVLIGGLPFPATGDLVNAWVHHWLRRAAGAAWRRLRSAHPEARRSCGEVEEPIGVVDGNVFADSADANLSGFAFTRHYDSNDRETVSALGPGHRHGLERELRVWLHRAIYVDERGTLVEFPAFRGKESVHCAGYVLTKRAGGAYEVAHRGEVSRFVSRDGHRRASLVTIRTLHAAIALVRGPDDRLSAVRAGNRLFELRYDDRARLVGLDDERGVPIVAYSYDRRGRLAELRDAYGLRETFAYDVDGRLTEWRDKRGYRFEWRYDAEGRCVFSTGEDGHWCAELEYLPGKTRVVRGAGQVTEHHYDARGLVTRLVRPDGAVLVREPDLEGRIVCEVDAGGREVRWLYDSTDAHVARVDRFGHVLLPEAESPADEGLLAHRQPATLAGQMGVPEDTSPSLGTVMPSALLALSRWALPEPAPVGEWSFERDHMGRVVTERDPRGRTIRHRRDPAGNVVETVDRDGSTTLLEITSWNLVGAATDGLGRRRELRYGLQESVCGYRDASGTLTEYLRDDAGRVASVVRDGVARERYVFDRGDRLLEKRDAAGALLLRVTPHENALPGVVALASGGSLVFDYDQRGRHTRASTDAHEVYLARSAADVVLLDRRDGRGMCRSLVGSTETSVLFERFECRVETNVAGLLVRDPRGRLHSFTVTAERCTRSLSNGTHETLAFDEEGRLTGRLAYRGSSDLPEGAWGVRYERSAEGDLLSLWDSVRGRRSFDIDACHRLVGETGPDGKALTFVLDAADNVLEKPGLQRAEMAAGSVIRRTERETFEHDARGRLAVRRQGEREVRYFYDSLDQLVRVDDGSGDCWTATYDGLGRRCRFGRPGSFTELFWDGDRICAELYANGALRVHVYPSSQALIPFMFVDYASAEAEPESGHAFYVFHDASGMPIQIEDESGRLVWWVDRVDPFGALEIDEGAEIEYRLRWPGHYADPCLSLHYNRYRDYDPHLARYLQPDPLGHAGSPGSLYAYPANPLISVDLLGLHEAAQLRRPGDAEGDGARPLMEQPPESPDAVRARHGREWAVDPITRMFDATLTMFGLLPEDVDRLARLPAHPGESHAVFRRRRYLNERIGQPVRAMARWARDGFQSNVNRAVSSPNEAASLSAVRAPSNNGVNPETYEYREWVDRRDRSLGSLRDHPQRPPGAVGEPRVHVVRPDGLRGGDVVEHKHLSNPSGVLYDSAQLRAEAEMARRRGGVRVIVITSESGISSDTGEPTVRPTEAVARTGIVHYYDTESGQITHTFDTTCGAWMCADE